MGSRHPNILILMVDQMQGRVLEPGHPCATPNLDKLAARGVRVSRAYTPNAVCSPARASLMTGRLPHSHGVVQVTHCVDRNQAALRTDLPHWAQRLTDAGYRTGYFGKWHVEHTDRPQDFGWSQVGMLQTIGPGTAPKAAPPAPAYLRELRINEPSGYNSSLLAAVTQSPPQMRSMGQQVDAAEQFLQRALAAPQEPWCCMVSLVEPHDPFVCGQDSFEAYEPESVSLPENLADPMLDKPSLYRKAARAFAGLSPQDHCLARACYYTLISELDGQLGRLLSLLESAGRLDDTIVIFTSDHGELLGAHGLYMKNAGAFEEVYHIPLLAAGPGLARGTVTDARVGLHDLCPTICELAGVAPIDTAGESRSIASLLANPAAVGQEYQRGFAEYYGTRYWLTQRIYWEGPWKFVFNGFDEDELYDLAADPGELRNLAAEPAHRPRAESMMRAVWDLIRQTNDLHLLRANYPALRYARVGPG